MFTYPCQKCGAGVNPMEWYSSIDGRIYCDSCYKEVKYRPSYFCEPCDKHVWSDEGHSHDAPERGSTTEENMALVVGLAILALTLWGMVFTLTLVGG